MATTELMCTPCCTPLKEPTMNLKSIAILASTLVAASTWAAAPADQKCGAGSCGKKETAAKKDTQPSTKEASCSKKDAACAKKDAPASGK